jgi:uncharacterized protein YecT (DUF1311 family)
MRSLSLALALIVPMWHAQASAFDDWCKTAKLPSSIAICSDPELQALAEERQNAFDEAKSRLDPGSHAALVEDQKGWVGSYSRACGIAPNVAPSLPLAPPIKECMARAGRARIAYLRAYVGAEHTAAMPSSRPSQTPSTPPSAVPPPQAAPPYDPKRPFETREGALLCSNYFAIKDAKAARAAGDRAWFEKTGCVIAQGRLKIILTDAPVREYDLAVWRGRVYPEGSEDGANVYFEETEVLTYATPYPATEFASIADAEAWYAKNVSANLRQYVPRRAIASGMGKFQLLLGPASHWALRLGCNRDLKCEILGKRPG